MVLMLCAWLLRDARATHIHARTRAHARARNDCAAQEKLLSMLGDDATKAKFLDEWERKPAGGTDRWHAL
eukprot:1277273-Pleurochrysis_carterae.AAC.1